MRAEITNLKELGEYALRTINLFKRPALILLEGDLGAGKTAFVKKFCEHLGYKARKIKSPSFSLINVYKAKGLPLINHLDLYRLEKADMYLIEELKELLKSADYTFVEWGERIDDINQFGHEINTYKIKLTQGQDDIRSISYQQISLS